MPFVLLVLPLIALCFSRQADLGFLMGWRKHLKIGRFIADTPALGPREAQVHNFFFPGEFRDDFLNFLFCTGALKSLSVGLLGSLFAS